jgi:hypothetical protein
MESPTSLIAAAALDTSPPPRVPRPHRPRRRLTLAALVAIVVAVAAPAADAETRNLKLLSDGPFATDPALPAGFLYESPDGTRVFFQTDEALAGTDTDATLDAYMRTSAGAQVHITDNPFAADGPVDAYLTYIAADGTRAFFDTNEKLAGTDTDDVAFDAYERTAAGALVHHSDSPAADADMAAAYFAGVTPDGRHAYFESNEKLAATDTDNGEDIYERGPAGPIHLSDGPKPDGNDFNVEFQDASDDGARIYFSSNERLLDSDTDDSGDVYLRTAAGLVHISDDPTGADAEEEADFIDETADGARVWFATRESLAAADTDTGLDIYERAPSGALTLLSDDPTGPDANVDALYRGRSSDGRRIVFETTESLAASDTGAADWDVYERLPDGKLIHVSDDPTGPDANVGATYNGMSSDGTRVLFATDEAMAATDTDTTADVYERLPNGALLHVSDDPLGPDDAIEAGTTATSSDASRIFFTTRERLAPTDTDNAWDTYERSSAGLRHVTDNPIGPDANVDPYLQYVSPDGRRVYFTTDERLARADTDAVGDVYVSTAVATPPVTPRPADRVAPAVSGFKVNRRGHVRFTLSEPADVRIVVRRRGAPARTRVLDDRPAGANRARVRIRARGRYRVAISATDAAGNRSAPRRVSVRVKGSR